MKGLIRLILYLILCLPNVVFSDVNFSSLQGFTLGPSILRKATFNSLTSGIGSYECVKSEMVWKDVSKSYNGLYKPIQQTEIKDILSEGQNYKYFERFDDGGISVWKWNAPDTKTVELYYSYIIEAGQVKFNDTKMTLSIFTKAQKVLDTCGDHYFSSVTLGAAYLVKVTINFSSSQKKERLSAKAGLQSASLYNLIGQLKKISGDGDFKVYYSTLKLGGSKESDFKNNEIHEQLFMCNNQDLEVCDGINKKTLEFLSAPDGFLFEVIKDKSCFSCLKGLKYKLSPLSDLRKNLLIHDYTQRQEIIRNLHQQRKSLWNLLKTFSTVRIQSDQTSEKVKAGELRIHEAILKIETQLKQCYERDKTCQQLNLPNSEEIKPPEHDAAPDFLFLCTHPNQYPKEVYHSIDVLFEYFKTVPTDYMACEDLQNRIMNVTRLNLQGRKLSDLTAFRDFTHFTHLDLKNNLIEDLSSLPIMEELVELNLRDNYLESLAHLAKNEQLQVLNISYNPIMSWKGLAELKNLKQLRAHTAAKRIPEELESELKARLREYIPTTKSACLFELDKLLKAGIISQLEYTGFRIYSMAPKYDSNSKISAFLPCDQTVEFYE